MRAPVLDHRNTVVADIASRIFVVLLANEKGLDSNDIQRAVKLARGIVAETLATDDRRDA